MTTNNYKSELVLALALHSVAIEERDAARAEVERLRTRVGWLDHLDTPEGRAMHATEAVLVDNEQLRADLREAVKLIGQAWSCKEPPEWQMEAWELLEKHKEMP